MDKLLSFRILYVSGLDQEGIYRVNGNAKVIEALRVSFDKVGDANFTDNDIYSIGGILKLFLVSMKIFSLHNLNRFC